MKGAVSNIALLLCGVSYVHSNIVSQVPGITSAPSDFQHYHRAAQSVLEGKSPFASADFNYPPLTPILLAPIGLLSYVKARWIWFALSHVFLLAAAGVLWRGLGGDRVAAVCVAVVWAFGGAAGENLSLGQIGPLLVLLLAIAYTSEPRRAAIAIGAGFALKLIPGISALAFVFRRDWRGLAFAVTAAFVLVIPPWAAVVLALPGPSVPGRTDYWAGTPAVLNWSLPATALRALDPPVEGPRLPSNWEFGNYLPNLGLTPNERLAAVSVAVAALVAGFAALVIASRGKLAREQLPAAMASLVCLGLAAAPVCWSHYQILQYPGIALLLREAIRLRRTGTAVMTVVCGAFLYPIPVAMLGAYYAANGGAWTAESPWLLWAGTTMTPVACLVLYGTFLSLLRQRTPAPSSA